MNVKVYDSFSQLPGGVTAQFSFPAQKDFFQSLEWFTCVFDTAMAESVNPRIYCVHDSDGRPLGLLVCGVDKKRNEIGSLTNFYTMSYGPVVFADSVSAASVIEHVVEFMRNERPKWSRIELRYLADELMASANPTQLLRDKGFSAQTFFMYDNWYLPVTDNEFERYYSQRSSRLKNTIKRKEKKLLKTHAVDIKIHTDPGAELLQATSSWVAIYNKSWKNPEPFPDFAPRLIETLSTLGILCLGMLTIDSQPAAAQLWITTKEKAIIYKLAYDETYSEWSPGSILSREMFRHAIDTDKVAEIDYGVGSEPYKKDWMTDVRRLHGVQALNRGTISGAMLATAEYAKSLVKRMRGG